MIQSCRYTPVGSTWTSPSMRCSNSRIDSRDGRSSVTAATRVVHLPPHVLPELLRGVRIAADQDLLKIPIDQHAKGGRARVDGVGVPQPLDDSVLVADPDS